MTPWSRSANQIPHELGLVAAGDKDEDSPPFTVNETPLPKCHLRDYLWGRMLGTTDL
jgi:hypothetical protein